MHKISEGVLWCLAVECWQWNIWVLWVWGWVLQGPDLLWHVPQLLGQIWIWVMLGPGQHIGPFLTFLRSVNGHWGLVGWCASSGVHMNGGTQRFPAEHSVVTRLCYSHHLLVVLILWLISVYCTEEDWCHCKKRVWVFFSSQFWLESQNSEFKVKILRLKLEFWGKVRTRF